MQPMNVKIFITSLNLILQSTPPWSTFFCMSSSTTIEYLLSAYFANQMKFKKCLYKGYGNGISFFHNKIIVLPFFFSPRLILLTSTQQHMVCETSSLVESKIFTPSTAILYELGKYSHHTLLYYMIEVNIHTIHCSIIWSR